MHILLLFCVISRTFSPPFCSFPPLLSSTNTIQGIHYGEPSFSYNPLTRRLTYNGPVVNYTTQLSAESVGGQILVSPEAALQLESSECYPVEYSPEVRFDWWRGLWLTNGVVDGVCGRCHDSEKVDSGNAYAAAEVKGAHVRRVGSSARYVFICIYMFVACTCVNVVSSSCSALVHAHAHTFLFMFMYPCSYFFMSSAPF